MRGRGERPGLRAIERARESESEGARKRERESERAGKRASERESEQARERAKERESQRAREREKERERERERESERTCTVHKPGHRAKTRRAQTQARDRPKRKPGPADKKNLKYKENGKPTCRIISKERKAFPSFFESFIVAISALSAVCSSQWDQSETTGVPH